MQNLMKARAQAQRIVFSTSGNNGTDRPKQQTRKRKVYWMPVSLGEICMFQRIRGGKPELGL